MQRISKVFTLMGAILALAFCAVSCKTDDDNEPTMYTVTVSDSLEHGKVTADKSSAEAGAKVKLTATADSGYELDSYSVKDEKSNTIPVTEGTFTMPKSNVTVSATFKETAETASYTVKHLQQNIADDNYTLKESETKTGKIGDETDASAKSYDGFTAQGFTQVTIAASGTEVEIKYDRKTYTVTFDSNDGSDVSSQSLRYEAKATEPADPTKTATASTEYTFEGWYSDSGLTTPFSFDTAIKKDITLYAKWTEKAVIQAGSISYATTTVSKTTDDESFTNELTKTGDGTVTYSSSDESVATVNADGLVTIVGTGTATITATVTDSASYTYTTKTASYTVTVVTAKSTAETPSIAQADCTFSPSNGTSTLSNANITTAMEYSIDNGTTWTDVTSNGSIASLAAGTVQICVKETADKLASEAVSITVPEVLQINELVGPYYGDRLTCEYYAGETWQALVDRYDLIKAYSGKAAFGSDGFIYYESGGGVPVTALVDNTKTYKVE